MFQNPKGLHCYLKLLTVIIPEISKQFIKMDIFDKPLARKGA
jgi:hypothetical protein